MKIFIKKSSCFDIVDSVTFYRDHRIEKSACLSLKCFPNALLLRACLPQDSGHRTLQNFEIEFLDSKERNQFLEYLKRNRFFLEKQRKKFLVLINPVSGKGKAKGIKYYTYYIQYTYVIFTMSYTGHMGPSVRDVVWSGERFWNCHHGEGWPGHGDDAGPGHIKVRWHLLLQICFILAA